MGSIFFNNKITASVILLQFTIAVCLTAAGLSKELLLPVLGIFALFSWITFILLIRGIIVSWGGYNISMQIFASVIVMVLLAMVIFTSILPVMATIQC